VDAPPFVCRHLNGVCTSHHARETAQYVYAAEHLGSAFHSRCDAMLVAYVDGFGYDARVREFGV
jgi:hypothetical protein